MAEWIFLGALAAFVITFLIVGEIRQAHLHRPRPRRVETDTFHVHIPADGIGHIHCADCGVQEYLPITTASQPSVILDTCLAWSRQHQKDHH